MTRRSTYQRRSCRFDQLPLSRWLGIAATQTVSDPAHRSQRVWGTPDHVTHNLKIVGRTDALFSADAITLIHNASRGYPRAIDNLAVNALTAAFAHDSSIVDEKSRAAPAISEAGAD